jgi:hypothetical protein
MYTKISSYNHQEMANQQEEMMIDKSVAVYTIIADILKAIGHKDDPRSKMTDAEVITTLIIASIYFGGVHLRAMEYLKETSLIPKMLSKSRFNRRAHQLMDLLSDLFNQIGWLIKEANIYMEYVIDSFPIPVCDNIRICRSRIVKGEEFRGYIASKKRYFYGIRAHVIVTTDGIPVEVTFLPGSRNDLISMYSLPVELPAGSEIHGDSAYNCYHIEDALEMVDNVNLDPIRKKNLSRYDSDRYVRDYKRRIRKIIENAFSQITAWFPKTIHAVTLDGFLLKVFSFIFAFTIDMAFIRDKAHLSLIS